MSLGILGGTFNPPHLGHLLCAQEARHQLGLERVLLIPTGTAPHKTERENPGPEHRLALCHAAAAGDDGLDVSDLEMRREGPSFTVDTLEELTRQDPNRRLYFILGGDAAAGLAGWHRPERVLELATLAVARRRGTPPEKVRQALERVPGGDRTEFFKMPRIGISSTMIRGRVRSGAPIRYMVPEAVSAYISEQGLYGGAAHT